MGKIFPIFLLVLFLAVTSRAFAFDLSEQYLVDMGKESFTDGDYGRALTYFQQAQELDPDSKEPLYYINLIKRIGENRITVTREQSSLDSALDAAEENTSAGPAVTSTGGKRHAIDATLDYIEGKIKPSPVQPAGENIRETKPAYAEAKSAAANIYSAPSSSSSNNVPVIARQTRPTAQAVEKVIELKKENANLFPLSMDVFINQSFIVRSPYLKRYLAVTDKVVQIDRLDETSIRVTGLSLGPTIFYVWDDTGRWIFKLQVVSAGQADIDRRAWERNDAFKFTYDNNWRSYYQGPAFSTIARNSLIFDQDLAMRGPTPYGDFDASAAWTLIGKDEKINAYTVGLAKGQFFNFNDFNIRGFDFSNAFSPLSFPGTTLRGIYFSSPAFNHNLEYTYMQGSDKGAYGYLSSGLVTNQKSYIEGAQVKLFPLAKNSVIFNYARGWGPDRESYLKDEVYSVESSHRLGNLSILNEGAYDVNTTAVTSAWTYHLPKLNLRASVRDTDKNFLTISGRPPNSGEVGGIVGFDWRPTDRFYLTSDLDSYRDRQNFNPNNFHAINYNWNGSSGLTLTPTLSWTNNAYYSDSPELTFPQRSLNLTSTLNKNSTLHFAGKHSVTTYVGYTYQDSRNPLSPSSDYTRDSLFGGLRISLVKDLYAYGSYTNSWLKDLDTGTPSNPAVLEAGLDYNQNLTKSVSGTFRLYYRKESGAGSIHSFLAGEDSAEGSASLSYRPARDVEIFADGRLRQVWPLDHSVAKHVEVDMHLGTKIVWDSFFVWAPSVKILGYVFKDSNGNGKRDKGEEPIVGARINIGPQVAISDKNGKYHAVVRAKSVTATLDIGSIPRGYVLTTSNSVRIDTVHAGQRTIDFGVSSQSGVFGIVFYDANGNGKFDKDDKPIAKARITLDGKRVAVTNGEGVYFFTGLNAGKYTIAIDINSIPLEYLPTIAVRQEIDVVEGSTAAYHIPLKKR